MYINEIYSWLLTCPHFNALQAISSKLEDAKEVVQSKSSENIYNVTSIQYEDGGYKHYFKPREPYFFDVDVICYRAVYADQSEYNMVSEGDVQKICDWLIKQQNEGGVPNLDPECYQIECLTPKPYIRGIYENKNDPGEVMVDYAVTIRFYTDNPGVLRVVVR